MRYSKMRATKRRSDEATKGKIRATFPLRRSLAPSLRRFPPACSPAFSLVEIMIVVVIIGLLAGVVTYATGGILERAKRTKARSDISTLAGAVDNYYGVNGKLPDNRDGLQLLVPGFIKVLPKDPWGNPYVYVQPGKIGPFDIISYGADGREGGTGVDADITSNDTEVKDVVKK